MTEPTIDNPAPNVPRAIFAPRRLVEVCSRCRFEERVKRAAPLTTFVAEIDREILYTIIREHLAHSCRRAG